MENSILITVDTENGKVDFGKPQDFTYPNDNNKNEVIINDIKTITHGLGSYIKIAEDMGVSDCNTLIDEAIKLLKETYKK